MFSANQKPFVICTRVTEELHSFLSQSELSNFFVYIIMGFNLYTRKNYSVLIGCERSAALQRPLLKHPCDDLFFSTSVANETENLNMIWFKLNQWAKIHN